MTNAKNMCTKTYLHVYGWKTICRGMATYYAHCPLLKGQINEKIFKKQDKHKIDCGKVGNNRKIATHGTMNKRSFLYLSYIW